MRFVAFRSGEREGLGVLSTGVGGGVRGLFAGDPGYPGDLMTVFGGGWSALAMAHSRLLRGGVIHLSQVVLLPPIPRPGKLVRVGANYVSTLAPNGPRPPCPALFPQHRTTLVGHNRPLVWPGRFEQLDYGGELVVVIGRGGRHIPRGSALEHVAGYSIFNDVSSRDGHSNPRQATAGQGHDGTGAIGPVLVTADELPSGGRDLSLVIRLNGEAVQRANTSDMLFDVPTLLSVVSERMTLEPGDVLATGTPACAGAGVDPGLLSHGAICETEIERIGTLRNRVVDETDAPAAPLLNAR
jgi:2-keto-4-pentenoate hydratase/2-oxohepta-3-ene-1,7-dioic acid hydratase in catechol pathway